MTIITDEDFTTGIYLTGSVGAINAVFITESNFLVKYGYRVRASKAEVMKFIRKVLPDIHVPEVYSHWVESDGRGFIVMAPLPGKLLHTE